MKNSGTADFVSATMDKIMKSASHKSLFRKYASDESHFEEMTEECEDCRDLGRECKSCHEKAMHDEDYGADDTSVHPDDDFGVEGLNDDFDDLASTASHDVAIDSLLTASAALDTLGFNKTSALSLKIASIVLAAKKKKTDEKKAKKDGKKDPKKDSKKDMKADKDGKKMPFGKGKTDKADKSKPAKKK